MPTDEEVLFFNYKFKFKDEVKEFPVYLNRSDLSIIQDPKEDLEIEWALMETFACPHCPLDPKVHKYCPLAQNLYRVLKEFSNFNSFEKVEVEVTTVARKYVKETPLQGGLSSLIGILMPASGCPIMGKLKPMLHTHLPFATLDETQIRVFSMYLLSQYLKMKKGEKPDWEMNKLVDIYEDIAILNKNVSKQIIKLSEKDAGINGLIILHNFAEYVTFTINEKLVEEIEYFMKGFNE
ncbi:MAG: hypothetical protein LC102_02240 [Ignavibacteriales bacterium]|nr:MAG: hypothetical protein F9K26_03210 [Ignavibacteriaceae bacterium]MBW7872443.1 hypothetical protein [Ignavibacteria bacterium]MCZ2142234.1 hypothetical protein [Ignavibacteriales bacterium]OQY73368.1 MAG: hypothetical protein B6D45_08175 [Ignavibacteriales bacterium UTCHB3]MBV6445409.1 hypothetical protein [Ignavibacteriaceae bacterium]